MTGVQTCALPIWDIRVERQTSYDQLVGLMQSKYPWGNDEGVVFSKWNSSNQYFVLVRNDEDVVSMYDENEEDKIIKILVQFCKNGEEEKFAQSLLQPIRPSPGKEVPKLIVEDLTQKSEYEYEIPEENLTRQEKSKEGYEGEDHVGIDEEDQYLDGDEQENGGGQAKDADHKATEDVSQDVEEDSDEHEEDSDDHDEDSDGDPSMTSIALKKRLLEKYHVDIDYQRVLAGRRIALDQIFGKWEDSFECLHNWQAEVLRKCPTSIVVINHKEIEGQQRFTRAFVYFRACIDEFLLGCRPYLSVDATALNGKWKGQLAVACGVDGHNWLYPVAYVVFDSETKEN